jgi:hypothetical protein
VVALNRAAAVAEAGAPERALELVDSLELGDCAGQSWAHEPEERRAYESVARTVIAEAGAEAEVTWLAAGWS